MLHWYKYFLLTENKMQLLQKPLTHYEDDFAGSKLLQFVLSWKRIQVKCDRDRFRNVVNLLIGVVLVSLLLTLSIFHTLF